MCVLNAQKYLRSKQNADELSTVNKKERARSEKERKVAKIINNRESRRKEIKHYKKNMSTLIRTRPKRRKGLIVGLIIQRIINGLIRRINFKKSRKDKAN